MFIISSIDQTQRKIQNFKLLEYGDQIGHSITFETKAYTYSIGYITIDLEKKKQLDYLKSINLDVSNWIESNFRSQHSQWASICNQKELHTLLKRIAKDTYNLDFLLNCEFEELRLWTDSVLTYIKLKDS